MQALADLLNRLRASQGVAVRAFPQESARTNPFD